MSIYDEVEIEDMDFDKETGLFTFDCPCGDKFRIGINDIKGGKAIATCPSCSLMIRVIFDEDSYKAYEELMK